MFFFTKHTSFPAGRNDVCVCIIGSMEYPNCGVVPKFLYTETNFFYKPEIYLWCIHIDSSTIGAQNGGGASGLEHLSFTILCIVMSYFKMWFLQFYSSKLLLILIAFVYYAWGKTWALWKEDYLGNSHVQKCMLFNKVFGQHQLQSKRILCWFYLWCLLLGSHTNTVTHKHTRTSTCRRKRENPFFPFPKR